MRNDSLDEVSGRDEPLELLCAQFQADWSSGRRPSIAAYVARAAPAERPVLLARLLPIDREFRGREGAPIRPADDRADLPEFAGVIDDFFVPPSAPVLLEPSTVPGAGAASNGEPPPPSSLSSQFAGRFALFGEIARGGMGAVLRARDPKLNRDLAVKVLHERFARQPEYVSRFLEEVQIAGQLQHPGIVPIHDVGELPDGRPYFAMKLIKGRTLKELLSDRPTLDHERPRFVQIFEQVCQAVGYAHSKGVIHRDLKPANVMVGAFGEVQVMDWGLAKVLASRERDRPVGAPPETAVASPRGDTPEAGTRVGAALGTWAYMPPEQAAGAVGLVGPRSDVFGLGAVLCEMLTGQPPYCGDFDAVLLAAHEADLSAALASLDGCGADAELITLAKRCLARKPADRPVDGGAVAAEVAAYLSGVQERLRAAEVAQAAATARADAERRRRRTQFALFGVAALALLIAVAAAVTVAWREWKSKQNLAAAGERTRRSLEQAAAASVSLIRMGGLKEAETPYRTALQLQQEVAAEFPERPDLRRSLGTMHNNLGELLRRAGRRDDAEIEFLSALAERQRLVDEFPDEPDYRFDLAQSHYNFGVWFADVEDWPAAIDRYQAALGLFVPLCSADSQRTDYRRECAQAHNNLANALRNLKRLDPAAAEHETALALRRLLAAEGPRLRDARRELGQSLNNLGNVRNDQRRAEEARQLFREALDTRLALAAEFPKLPDFQNDCAGTLGNLAGLEIVVHDDRAARRLLEQALPYHDSALAATPDYPQYLNVYRNNLTALAGVLTRLGDQAALTDIKNRLGKLLPPRKP